MPIETYLIAYFNALFELFKELWLFFLLGLVISALIQDQLGIKKNLTLRKAKCEIFYVK